MENKGFVTTEMSAMRIVAKGQILDLSENFRLGGVPFSLFLKTKNSTESIVLVNCKLYQDNDFGDCPIMANCWNEVAILELSASDSLLDDFDVYWGAANQIIE